MDVDEVWRWDHEKVRKWIAFFHRKNDPDSYGKLDRQLSSSQQSYESSPFFLMKQKSLENN